MWMIFSQFSITRYHNFYMKLKKFFWIYSERIQVHLIFEVVEILIVRTETTRWLHKFFQFKLLPCWVKVATTSREEEWVIIICKMDAALVLFYLPSILEQCLIGKYIDYLCFALKLSNFSKKILKDLVTEC